MYMVYNFKGLANLRTQHAENLGLTRMLEPTPKITSIKNAWDLTIHQQG